MILNQFDRTKLVRKNWRVLANYHAKRFSYISMASIFKVSIPTIHKILKEHDLIRKNIVVPVIDEESCLLK
jgi:predicted AAA+ superfamily ATPase